jgi:glucosamine--fructose-6-phosphate aminotransferase (isomerizing)
VPTESEIVDVLDRAVAAIDDVVLVTQLVGEVDALLKGLPGVMALVDRPQLVAAITARLDQLDAFAADLDRRLEVDDLAADELERRGAESIAMRDALWNVRNDRLRTAREVGELAGRDAGEGPLAAYLAIQQSFSALDRLEVRGRDSAGIHVFVHDHGLDLTDSGVQAAIRERTQDPTFQSGSVRVVGSVLSFVYKAAAEIGELGDNTRMLRAAVAGDQLLRLAVAAPTARTSVLGHTRWASVGIISEPNAHPINSDELETSGGAPYLVAALNGDVDNHTDLRVAHQLCIHAQITTDAKVIPALVSRIVAAGHD